MTSGRAATSRPPTTYRQALALFRETGDQAGEARALGNLGLAECSRAATSRPSHLQQALAFTARLGDRFGEARALGNLGLVDSRQGRYRGGRRSPSRPWPCAARSATGPARPARWSTSAIVELRQGHYQQASGHLEQALAMFREIGDRAVEADALTSLGEVDLRQGRYQQAADTSGRPWPCAARSATGRRGRGAQRPRRRPSRQPAARQGPQPSTPPRSASPARPATGTSRPARTTASRTLPGQRRRPARPATTGGRPSLYTDIGAPEAEQVRARSRPRPVTPATGPAR